ncbi:hypothetical protein OKW30_001196 [Paraburkholderia sp. Clong3]|uniref:hypothetical protein n=1 Tax=Paraburkholderia sp. Clong3 TaxID=2991061 RepID=UPI003D238909
MSFESYEAFREIKREEFFRKMSAEKRSFEYQLSKADTAEKREEIINDYVKRTNDAVNIVEMARWQPAYAALGSVLVWLAIWLLKKIPVAWDALIALILSPGVAYLIAPLTALVGWGFFLLRKRQRFSYAALEMGAACFTTYQITSNFVVSVKSETIFPYVLAMMGSIYIAVRAYDNFDKWFHPDIETFKRLVAEAQAALKAQTEKSDIRGPASAVDD